MVFEKILGLRKIFGFKKIEVKKVWGFRIEEFYNLGVSKIGMVYALNIFQIEFEFSTPPSQFCPAESVNFPSCGVKSNILPARPPQFQNSPGPKIILCSAQRFQTLNFGG